MLSKGRNMIISSSSRALGIPVPYYKASLLCILTQRKILWCANIANMRSVSYVYYYYSPFFLFGIQSHDHLFLLAVIRVEVELDHLHGHWGLATLDHPIARYFLTEYGRVSVPVICPTHGFYVFHILHNCFSLYSYRNIYVAWRPYLLSSYAADGFRPSVWHWFPLSHLSVSTDHHVWGMDPYCPFVMSGSTCKLTRRVFCLFM